MIFSIFKWPSLNFLVLEITCFPQYMRAFTLLIYSPGNIKSNWKLKTKVGLLGVFLVSSEFALYYYYYYYYYIYFVKAFNVYCDLHTNNKCKTLADTVWRGNHKP